MDSYFLDRSAPSLDAVLRRLLNHKLVFFAGMPGTGKSLLVHQLVHLAHREGRRILALQWDIARPVFEASEAGRRYPQVDSITDIVIRRATGLWARDRIAGWDAGLTAGDILVGEVPLIGNRFSELARKRDDEAEAVLTSPDCRFLLPVPSDRLRDFIMDERRRRFAAPLNEREREDAPPHAMRDMWLELLAAARGLGVPYAAGPATGDYDAAAYERVYAALLRHRRLEVLRLDKVLPTQDMSVYDISAPVTSLAPTPDEAARFIGLAEQEPADRAWWDV